jgi:lipoprotein-releasing system ATP-binding protein
VCSTRSSRRADLTPGAQAVTGGSLGLRAEGLCKSFPTRSGPLSILRNISLTVPPAQAAVVLGPSGSGKSTLLHVLGTLEAPTAGGVTLGDVAPFSLPPHELARFRNRSIGFVFQDHHLLASCTALENVLLPTLISRRPDAPARARELLRRVGMGSRLDHPPSELSGGERQRVALARALINRPLLVLADEPTGNLDRATAEAVVDLLLELHAREGFVLIIVTHSERVAARAARRYELVDGALRDAARFPLARD